MQASASPSAYESWRQRKPVEMPDRTFAEGLATGAAFSMPQAILQALLDDFVLVDDDIILKAMVWYAERAHTLAEGAGAAPLAAAWQMRDQLAGKKVGLVLSGVGALVIIRPHGIAIADVAGKGVPAALIMATFRAALRTQRWVSTE